VKSLLRVETKAPFVVAVLIGVPLYFAALMASSLALDKPRIVGKHEFPGTAGAEAKIWLAALIAPGIVVAAGLVGLGLRRFGIYLAAATGIVCCLVLPGMSQGWVARHTARFPLGVDFIKDNDPSNLSSRGEWEHAAQATIVSITHWTLGLCIGVVVVGVLLEVRHRRGGVAAEYPPVAITGEPEASPVVELDLADSDLIRGDRPGRRRWR
jgi:hypothetical protein